MHLLTSNCTQNDNILNKKKINFRYTIKICFFQILCEIKDNKILKNNLFKIWNKGHQQAKKKNK